MADKCENCGCEVKKERARYYGYYNTGMVRIDIPFCSYACLIQWLHKEP